ncbi:bifunctional homocysteine S-methyltransferase/methylenetetrahydrofolate reductase [Bacillaceae bacterium SIJ1]|uniref:bifunctional homocysteine S-methyltransferase/methylenetetrahydrofolate reductase n=1 Tax=Litoribacterium kuwaitense TaxID=1398745 RepID=UPI0013ECE9B1|nr:bifunctional homocysteine S-methyltransferase/methylenetetrahydrofolate reductase [Litoribacterium kuwaitense]NGP44537.1 bifunctional homocysteine S-methyltransferase/methylenetetrahydrofolate reductase [Litoribacterium kuwaitense]
MTFIEKLQKQHVILDGAMGSYLYDAYQITHCFERVNLTNPSYVKEVHRAYVDAGADVIKTNTYAANAIKLAKYGLEEQVEDINRAAVRLAKEAAKDRDVFVAGTIGGIRDVTRSETTLEKIVATFEQQVDALISEGVDALLFETYYDEEELQTVVALARKKTNIFIIAQLSLQEAGRLQNGKPLTKALKQLALIGADVVGINCRLGPYHTIEALKGVPLLPNVFLSAAPNAGMPDVQDGRLFFKSQPEYFGDCALSLRKQGVRLIGGCCGTTPAHIAAMASAVQALEPVSEKTIVKPLVEEPPKPSVSPLSEKPLHQLVQERTSVIVELDPPKHLDVSEYFKGAVALHHAGVDAVTIADNSLASPRVCNTSIATILKNQYNIKPLVHLSCRDRNLIGLQSHIMGLHTSGIHDILGVTGDPTKLGDFPGATSVYDVQSFELIKLLKQFNEGFSPSGKPLKEKAQFSVAGAFNPNVKNMEKAIKRLEKKITYGADYFISQPVFSEAQIKEVAAAVQTLSAPMYIGIMPLTGYRNAEFLHHEVPGIKLADDTRARMAACKDDPKAARREGLAIAKHLIDVAMDFFSGIYIITPFLKYDWSVDLVEHALSHNKAIPLIKQT